MCSDKSDINFAGSENNNSYKSIIVTLNVKYIPIVTDIIHKLKLAYMV
jgi:hypothetical protein